METRKKPEEGFTLVEMLTTTAIILLLTTFAVLGLFQNRRSINLDTDTKLVVGVLREAQQRAVTGDGGLPWGVCTHTDSSPHRVELRQGAAGPTCDGALVARYNLSQSSSFAAPGVFIFAKISGTTTPGQIILQSQSETRTISVDANGVPSY